MEGFKKVFSWPNGLLAVAGSVTLTGLGNYLFKDSNFNYLLFMLTAAGVLAGVWFFLKKGNKKK